MATLFFRNATTAWNTITNWSLTSGGPSVGVVPTATDDVIFDVNSGNCTITGVGAVCKSFDSTNFTGTLTPTSGLIVSGNVTIGTNCIVNALGNLIINSTSTVIGRNQWFGTLLLVGGIVTLAGGVDFSVGNLSTSTGGGSISPTIAERLIVRGGISLNNGGIIGTGTIVLNGSGTLTSTNSSSSPIACNLTIATSGIIVFGSQFGIAGGTLTYTSGTVQTTGNALTLLNSVTLNTAGIIWNQLGSVGNANVTLTSTLTANNTTANMNFLGSFGFVIGTLNIRTSDTLILAVGPTYIITTAIISTATLVARAAIRSGTSGTQAIFNLNYGATQDVSFVTTTDIDSSSGQTIWCWKLIQSNTINWKLLSSLSTQSSSTFVN